MIEWLSKVRFSVKCDECERYIHPREDYLTYEDKHYCSYHRNIVEQKHKNEETLLTSNSDNSS